MKRYLNNIMIDLLRDKNLIDGKQMGRNVKKILEKEKKLKKVFQSFLFLLRSLNVLSYTK